MGHCGAVIRVASVNEVLKENAVYDRLNFMVYNKFLNMVNGVHDYVVEGP